MAISVVCFICQFRDIEGMSLGLILISHCTKMKVLVFLSSDILFEKCIKLNLNKSGDDLLSSFPAIKKYPWLPVKFRGQGPYLGLPGTPLWSTLVLWSEPMPCIYHSPFMT